MKRKVIFVVFLAAFIFVAQKSIVLIFLEAIEDENLEVVRLIYPLVDLNQIISHERTPLMSSSEKGNKGIVEFLISKGADVNLCTSLNPLYLASRNGHEEIVDLLIENGADVNALTDWEIINSDQTPLMAAVEKDNIEIAEALIENGADVSLQDKYGNTAYSLAKEYGHIEILKYFNKIGIKPVDTDLIEVAARYGNGDAFFEAIAEGGLDLGKRYSDGSTLLMLACKSGNAAFVQQMIDSLGVFLMEKDKNGQSIIHYAAEADTPDVMELILSVFDLPVDIKDSNGQTPLMSACNAGNLEIAKLLINSGADVNSQDFNGNTPLLIQTMGKIGKKELLVYLIANGADINIVNNDGRCALYYALNDYGAGIEYGASPDIALYLISSGANPNIVDDEGVSIMSLVESIGDDKLIKSLEGR